MRCFKRFSVRGSVFVWTDFVTSSGIYPDKSVGGPSLDTTNEFPEHLKYLVCRKKDPVTFEGVARGGVVRFLRRRELHFSIFVRKHQTLW